MGEQEGGTNNSAVFQTLDSPVDGGDIQPLDLDALNTPTYRTITGRPDGGGGIGIEFNAAQMENLSGQELNRPPQSDLSEDQGGLYDLDGISDRGFQFWVRPTSAAAQSLVMDTDRHGARINSSGNFSMRYANVDYNSTMAVFPIPGTTSRSFGRTASRAVRGCTSTAWRWRFRPPSTTRTIA